MWGCWEVPGSLGSKNGNVVHGTLLKLGFNTMGTRLFPHTWNGTNVSETRNVDMFPVSKSRLVLLNLVFNNLPMFMMSFSEILKVVLKKLDYYRSRFFWQGSKDKKKCHSHRFG